MEEIRRDIWNHTLCTLFMLFFLGFCVYDFVDGIIKELRRDDDKNTRI
jgi:hypothetical protein